MAENLINFFSAKLNTMKEIAGLFLGWKCIGCMVIRSISSQEYNSTFFYISVTSQYSFFNCLLRTNITYYSAKFLNSCFICVYKFSPVWQKYSAYCPI